MLIEKVIPWALVYDRAFSPTPAAGGDGQVPAVDACLAALPGADGAPSAAECGKHPACVLHPDQLAARAAAGDPPLTPKSVACPRHFWGFQHVVEISPKVVRPRAEPVAEADVVDNGTPARLLAAFNDTLSLARAHLVRLSAPENTDPGFAVWESEFVGTNVRKQLEREDLDLIYLYCHARGGTADPARSSPCLEFSAGNAPAVVTPGDLVNDESSWTHNPLVILNGCGTVAFSPDALSPFIPILVDDRGAAGLLGTEISVWEQLAGEFAEHFLRAFISGRTAGAALVEARRRLLAQRNPLGLAYTLYANSDLRFASPQPPAAAAVAAASVTRSG
ncbi:MAG: CHAT domain-containing protein [Gemmatimonadetes bacterium]|nr:CHAT domain-containing protein [Gemmatimonadota bacterium]